MTAWGVLARWVWGFGALVIVAGLMAAPGMAQTAPDAAPTSPKVDEFLDLLTDPTVQEWLETQRRARQERASDAAESQLRTAPVRTIAARLAVLREHIAALGAALPGLPGALARARDALGAELEGYGPVGLVMLLAGFLALGFGAQWLFGQVSARYAGRLGPAEISSVRDRVIAVATRLALAMGSAAAFAIGGIGAFLAFQWPPLLKDVVLGYLLAFVAVRLAMAIVDVLLSPVRGREAAGTARLRVIPVGDEAAAFWARRVVVLVGWFAFGWVTVLLLDALGVSRPVRQILAYLLGLGLLAVGIEMVWRRPGAAPSRRLGRRAMPWLASIYFVIIWALWVVGATNLFWLAAIAVGLPVAIGLTRRAVLNVARPPDVEPGADHVPSLAATSAERGLRALLIVGAIVALAYAWHIDLVALTANDTLATRLVRGVFSAIIILLVADFVWQLLKTVIDLSLSQAEIGAEIEADERRRRQRLRTLLPILRNFLFVGLAVVAVLMALAAIGVEVGPLVAGAGVIGVAVGFGAQTVVKDIISGMFYLFDDAFRVGEYIQSGKYKGTVEGFSLRSIRLRHQRGPVFTVPFGELGAVENMSRDWVIDKQAINVTYDTDLDKVRKVIKDVGKALKEDPEHGPHILDTLKMQGVEAFGDFAITIRLKLTTKPGEQFVIRRKAFAMIKQAFEAEGIKFARPVVHVAGSSEVAAAGAARDMLERQKKVPEEEA